MNTKNKETTTIISIKSTPKKHTIKYILCFFIIISTIISAFPATAYGTSEASVTGEGEDVFKIKNCGNGLYISSYEGGDTDDKCSDYELSSSDEDDASQYFRVLKLASGKTVLNSAELGAEYSLSIADTSTEKTACKRKNEEASSLILTKTSQGLYEITTLSDETEYFLSASENGDLFFSDSRNKSSLWELEVVTPTTFSMSYFKTRIKLYSVDKLSVNIKPTAISSFLTWSSSEESVLLVSGDGTLCALALGNATVSAALGNLTLTCNIEISNKDSFTWYSQTNINNSYWNGGALSGIYFKKKPFASETQKDWMNEGCAISSVAMIFRNLGATYTNGYDFRSGQNGDLPADPYTVALANVGFSGFSANTGSYYADPVYTRWKVVTNAFKVNGNELTYVHKYSGNRATIKNALLNNPEGIVVQMTKADGDTHYIVIAECVNPEETKASKLQFIVYDPLSYDGSDGDGVLFEESASYKLGYRYSDFTSFYYWDVKYTN